MLARWNPFDELFKFERDLFRCTAKPAVDIYEDKEKIVLEAEFLGIDPKGVSIEVDGSILTLKGARKEDKDWEYSRIERVAGTFLRSFVLPDVVETDKVSAAYDKGILTVTMPKKVGPVPRRIEISGV
jgi:HSP20 family protein